MESIASIKAPIEIVNPSEDWVFEFPDSSEEFGLIGSEEVDDFDITVETSVEDILEELEILDELV